MSQFVDLPEMLPAFEPRFPVRRLIAERGGVFDKRVKDGVLSMPVSSMLDSLQATLGGLDPLFVALLFAGYDVREVVIATSNGGDAGYHAHGCLRASPRSGLGYGVGGSWPAQTHIVDGGDWYNVVALRVLAWRQPLEPAAAPVSLTAVAGFQAYADPADPDASARDGWIVLGREEALPSSQLVAAAAPGVVDAVVAAIEAALAAGGTTPPGLVRMLDPATWEVPLEREVPAHALRNIAEMVWDRRLRLEGGMAELLAHDGGEGAYRLDAAGNSLEALLRSVESDPDLFLGDLPDELERRRRVLEPLEGSLPNVLARLRRTHWALAVLQLHEYGMINVLPIPATLPPAIPVLDLTGFYISKTDLASGYIAMMQLNQAGDEVSGWWVDEQLEVWPIVGKLRPEYLAQGRFDVALTSTWDGSHGSLYVEPVPTRDPVAIEFWVSWETSSVIYAMRRCDRRARVEPGTVVSGVRKSRPTGIAESLLIPMHPVLKQRIDLLGHEILEHLETVTSLMDTNATTAVRSMDGAVAADAIAKGLAVAASGGGFEETALLVRVRAELRLFLVKAPVAAANGTSAWIQLQSVVTLYPNDSLQLKALLDVSSGPPHFYDYTLSGTGLEVGAGAIVGATVGRFSIKSKFTHKTQCAPADVDPSWADDYAGVMNLAGPSVGAQGGAEAIVAFHEFGTNDLNTSDEWLRDDFLCEFFAGELSAAVGFFPTMVAPGGEFGAELRESYLFLRARDGVWGTGVGGGTFVQGGIGAKIGAGVSFVGIWGRYTRRNGNGNTPSQVPTGPPPTLEVHGANRATTYFQQGSAWLTDAGRRVLLDLVLAYRPLLDDAGSFIILNGDASRTADTVFNRDLSRRRILAVYDYIRSLLTAPPIGGWPASCALAVGDSHILFAPYGESRPTWAGLPDEVETPEWRKATLVISGRSVETLQGAAVLYSPETQP